MRKDSNIDLTDCLWCPAFIWQYANMLRYTQIDWAVNVFSVFSRYLVVLVRKQKFEDTKEYSEAANQW
jgi:hypothetical protein